MHHEFLRRDTSDLVIRRNVNSDALKYCASVWVGADSKVYLYLSQEALATTGRFDHAAAVTSGAF